MARSKTGSGLPEDGAERRRVALTLALSLGLHLLLLAIALPFWLASEALDGISRGAPDFVMVTGQEPAKAPEPSLEPPTKAAALARAVVVPADVDRARARPLATTEAPADRPSDSGEEDSTAVAVAVESITGGGDPRGRDGGDAALEPGYGVLDGSLSPRPECLDGRDNDGDRLVDTEDPGCLPPPSTPAEEAQQRARAMLLSDLRRNDPLDGDPDELARERVARGLRDSRDGGLVYDDAGFHAEIDPDGEVRFARKRRPGAGGIGFDLGGPPRSRRDARQKLRFLEATEEVRDDLDQRRRDRDMKRALYGLRATLDSVWTDRGLSVAQKKAILFQRLGECDRETEDGRTAARTIAEFIRDHSRPRSVDRAAAPRPRDRPPPATPGRDEEHLPGVLAAPP